MKNSSVLCLWVLFLNSIYICKCDIYKLQKLELEVQMLKDLKDEADIDLNEDIGRLEDSIKEIRSRLEDLEHYTAVDEKCKETYRCNGVRFLPGCPCWSYIVNIHNETTTTYNFNKFYPNGTYYPTNKETAKSLAAGTYVTEYEEKVLRSCDHVKPPLGWRYIYEGKGDDDRLTSFNHCINNGQVECYCTSTRFRIDPKELSNRSFNEDSYKNLLQVCDEEKQYRCDEYLAKIYSMCPCWTYNATIENFGFEEINSTSVAINNERYQNQPMNIVICKEPYLHCSDERIAPGCPCWEFDVVQEVSNNEFTFESNRKLKLKSNRTDDQTDHFLKKICNHSDLLYETTNKGYPWNYFYVHCVNDGHVTCFCKWYKVAPVLAAENCPTGKAKINGQCVSVPPLNDE